MRVMRVLLVAATLAFVGAVEHATDVEIVQVEVMEVPWIGDSNPPPQQGYGPPQQEYGPPQQGYGPPQQEYGPPQQEYGPPNRDCEPPKPAYGPPPEEATTTESATTTEVPTTTELAKLRVKNDVEVGEYYVYHPKGLLQKVMYSTKDDVKNMEYSAKLRYEKVEPIDGPIYTYDPDSYEFQRIQK